MMRHLTVLGLAAALFLAGEARAQSTCNTTGIAAGCQAATPFSCPASPTCYAQLASCQADSACAGGTGTLTECNTTGIATGCTAGQPFSCSSSSHCFTTLTVCTTSGECLTTTGGTGGGGGTGTAATTCNTTGIAQGCSAAQPFSCAASTTCYSQLNACTASAACPTKPPGGGCTAAIGWAPSLALLLLVPWRRRQSRRR